MSGGVQREHLLLGLQPSAGTGSAAWHIPAETFADECRCARALHLNHRADHIRLMEPFGVDRAAVHCFVNTATSQVSYLQCSRLLMAARP